jgi:hypothetical protein
MIGSDAIVGQPDEPAANSVLKYDLNGKGGGQQVPMPPDQQTLTDTSISQADGKTIMAFTKLLVEPNENEILESGTNNFLIAWGTSNNFGYHGNNRFNFTKDFSADDTGSPSSQPSSIPSEAPSTSQNPTPPSATTSTSTTTATDTVSTFRYS